MVKKANGLEIRFDPGSNFKIRANDTAKVSIINPNNLLYHYTITINQKDSHNFLQVKAFSENVNPMIGLLDGITGTSRMADLSNLAADSHSASGTTATEVKQECIVLCGDIWDLIELPGSETDNAAKANQIVKALDEIIKIRNQIETYAAPESIQGVLVQSKTDMALAKAKVKSWGLKDKKAAMEAAYKKLSDEVTAITKDKATSTDVSLAVKAAQLLEKATEWDEKTIARIAAAIAATQHTKDTELAVEAAKNAVEAAKKGGNKRDIEDAVLKTLMTKRNSSVSFESIELFIQSRLLAQALTALTQKDLATLIAFENAVNHADDVIHFVPGDDFKANYPLKYDATVDYEITFHKMPTGPFLDKLTSDQKKNVKSAQADYTVIAYSPITLEAQGMAVYSLLDDPEFSLNEVTDPLTGATTYELVRDERDLRELKIGGALQIIPSAWEPYILTPHLDLGFTGDGQRFGGIVGLGLDFANNRVSLGAGRIFRQVQVLPDDFNIDNINSPEDFQVDKSWKSAWYFGLAISFPQIGL